jgi:biopolymer transport protein ExbD/biopolymer transport protein TolR
MNGFALVMVIVVFVLLTNLMLFSPFPPHQGVGINMPNAHHAVTMRYADRDDAMVVAITRDGKVYFGADPVQPGDLPAIIRERLTAGTEQKIYMKVDRRAKYGVVMEVLYAVRSAEVEKIGFLVEKISTP